MSGIEEVKATKGSEEPWDRNRYMNTDANSIRLPKIASQQSLPSRPAGVNDSKPLEVQPIVRNSTLNAEAVEFVPQWAPQPPPVVPAVTIIF